MRDRLKNALYLAEAGLIVGLSLLQLSGCSPSAPTANTEAEQPAAAAPARFPAAAIAAMKKRLVAESWVKDVTFNGDRAAVTWQIGVNGKGQPEFGYAEYVCNLLIESAISDPSTRVRIVDLPTLERNGGNFEGASLGRVDCATGAHDPV